MVEKGDNETYLDASIAEQLQCWSYALLELVFDSGETEQRHVSLQTLNDSRNLGRAVLDTHLGLMVASLAKICNGGLYYCHIQTESSSAKYIHTTGQERLE